MKLIKKFLTNIFVSVLLIYSVNIFITNLDYSVPINMFSILFTSILGFPGTLVYIILSIVYM